MSRDQRYLLMAGSSLFAAGALLLLVLAVNQPALEQLVQPSLSWAAWYCIGLLGLLLGLMFAGPVKPELWKLFGLAGAVLMAAPFVPLLAG